MQKSRPLGVLKFDSVQKIGIGILIFSLGFYGCARVPKASSVFPAASASAAEEVAIGEQIHAQILSSFYPYTEPKASNYLNEVGSALAAFAERKDLPYRFTLLYNDKIYAASSPGGFVYITTGFIFFLENEAELAAVLAHEIGQLQEKDPKLSKSRKILEAVTRGGTLIAPAFGEIGVLAALGLVMVRVMQERSQRTPADRLLAADNRALDYMVKAGYDPQGMIDLFYKFLNARREAAPYFFDYYQSRPITVERFQSLSEKFKQLPLQDKDFATHPKRYEEMTQGVREIYRRS